jgi:hypothetical protein
MDLRKYFGRKQTESRDGDEITEAGGEVNSEVTSLSAGGGIGEIDGEIGGASGEGEEGSSASKRRKVSDGSIGRSIPIIASGNFVSDFVEERSGILALTGRIEGGWLDKPSNTKGGTSVARVW